jgi:hypothetical protein
MDRSWNAALLDQLTFAWDYQFLPRLEGLTTTEYRWEPVSGCWSVRPNLDGGAWQQEIVYPDPTPSPFTTIAWRIAHITTVFGQRASNHFGDGTFDLRTVPWTGEASDALVLMTAEYDRWCEGVRALGEDGLFRPCGPAEGPFADAPFRDLVLHIHREFIHHAAEVMLLRDLYRDTAARDDLRIQAP